MNPKHKKALIRTSIIAALCVSPFLAKSYFIEKYASEENRIHRAIEPFFIEADDGSNLSRHTLFGTVHLLIHQGEDCLIDCEQATLDLLAEVHRKFGKEYFDQETRRMRVLLFSDQANAMSSIKATKDSLETVRFSSKQFDELLGSAKTEKNPDHPLNFAIIDPRGHLAYATSGDSPQTRDQVITQLSKINFNHYLSDYLGKRTFFGPKADKPGA